jgi:dTDP-4-dehydrorhamnose reductase
MKKTSIWITGAGGKIGSQLMKRLKRNTDYRVVGTNRDVDVTDMAAVSKAMEVYKPHVVINCASLSDPGYCEDHVVETFRINALGARNIAAASRQKNAKLIHLSTNEVFSGAHGQARTEFDFPNPRTVLGKSKLAGENFVKELNPKHLIIRSSWNYGGRDGKDDYVAYVLDKAKKGESFKAPLDLISTPTSTALIADFIEKMLDTQEYGIYHASCEGACTMHQYARMILRYGGYDTELVEGTYDEGDGLKVTILLENLMMKMTGIYEMPDWKPVLKDYIEKLPK